MSEEPTPIPNSEKQEQKNQVINKINQYGAEAREGIPPEDWHQMCRTINSKVLLRLINESDELNGIIYTVEPLKGTEVGLKSGWLFHSVGIVEKNEDEYLAFDQTNYQSRGDENEFFFAQGSLEEISEALEARFGSYWNLEFSPEDAEISSKISVAGKISEIDNLREQQPDRVFTEEDITPDKSPIPSAKKYGPDTEKPLGIKFHPPFPTSQGKADPKLRIRFTKPYS